MGKHFYGFAILMGDKHIFGGLDGRGQPTWLERGSNGRIAALPTQQEVDEMIIHLQSLGLINLSSAPLSI
jgi:hypothetical protein